MSRLELKVRCPLCKSSEITETGKYVDLYGNFPLLQCQNCGNLFSIKGAGEKYILNWSEVKRIKNNFNPSER